MHYLLLNYFFFNCRRCFLREQKCCLIYPLQKLKNFTEDDYLLLNGDPAIIGVTCAIASEMTNGKFKLLKWDRQEKTYYPIEINIYQK